MTKQQYSRDRLIKLIEDYVTYLPHVEGQTWEEACADYLIENGIIILPCKVGDTVYEVKRCTSSEAIQAGIPIDNKKRGRYGRDMVYSRNRPYKVCKRKMVKSLYQQVGKTVFLTTEDAQKALDELQGAQN